MHVFLMHHHAGTDMKKVIVLSGYFIVFLSALSVAQEVPPYSFVAEVNNPKDALIQLIYKNQSKFSQCIRAEDLELKLMGDSLYVKSENGGSIKYIGVRGRSDPRMPQKFIILPPDKEARASIHIDEYYDTRKENLIVSYSIPVIPCEKILGGYINIPPTVFMRDKINDPAVEKTDVYAADYPEWTQYGFIAVSKPLLIERSKINEHEMTHKLDAK